MSKQYNGMFVNEGKDYSVYHSKSKQLLNSVGYKGVIYRTATFWEDFIPKIEGPVKYLEIGAFQGANAISFGMIYGKHEKSEIHCIDPWEDYNDYNEYKNEQGNNYTRFLNNITKVHFLSKFYIHRGYSSDILPKFENEYFDIIYIDGNHEPAYVLEDAVLSYRKLKAHGYLIFDDYNWGETSKGIDNFLKTYDDKLSLVASCNAQLILRKL